MEILRILNSSNNFEKNWRAGIKQQHYKKKCGFWLNCSQIDQITE